MTDTTPRVDRTAPPPPGELSPFRFPDFERHELPNGLVVYAAPTAQPPLVELSLVSPAGAHHDPRGRHGLATLTAALLDEGTRQRSSLEIAATLERLGGGLSASADWDAGYVSASVLAGDLATGIELLAEVATSPSFPPEEVERLRKLRISNLRSRSARPDRQAVDALSRVLYEGTVYALPSKGTEATIAALDRSEITGFYERHWTPRGSALVAAGAFESGQLLAAVHSGLGSWEGPSEPAAPTIEPARREGVEVAVVDRPGAAQTELRVGHVGVRRNHPDRTVLQVLNALLGGKFTSRLNLSLRERHGLTYGVRSSFASRVGPGPFVIGMAVDTSGVGLAIEETLREVRRLREEPVDADEVQETKSYLLGIFPYSLQSLDGLVHRLETLAIHRLPDDHYDRYLEGLRAIEAADVDRVARDQLRPDDLKVVAVGPAESITEQLSGFGPVRRLDL